MNEDKGGNFPEYRQVLNRLNDIETYLSYSNHIFLAYFHFVMFFGHPFCQSGQIIGRHHGTDIITDRFPHMVERARLIIATKVKTENTLILICWRAIYGVYDFR